MAKQGRQVKVGPAVDKTGREIKVNDRVYYHWDECTVTVSIVHIDAITGTTDEGMRYVMDPVDCEVVS